MEDLRTFCLESLVRSAKIIQMAIANCAVKDNGMGKINGITLKWKTAKDERSLLNAQQTKKDVSGNEKTK